jgi:hypothetical protein
MSTKPATTKSTKPAPKPTTKGKSSPNSKATTPETTTTAKEEPTTPIKVIKNETKPDNPPTPAPTPPLTLERLQDDLQSLRLLVIDHSLQIAQILETLARKRKAVISTDKVQIKDIQTGNVYPSKNGAYQSMLKAGDLKELVTKGVFGPNPDKNTFGWYALVREWPDRFEEVKQQP